MPADVDMRQYGVMIFTFDHTLIVDQIFKARLSGEVHGFVSVIAGAFPQLDQLTETTEATDAWYVDYVQRATPAELDTVVDFNFVADGDAGRMSKGAMLAHVITHSASHRGAIGKMLENLKLAGAPDMVTTFQRRP